MTVFKQTLNPNSQNFEKKSPLKFPNSVIQRILGVKLVQYAFGKVKPHRFKHISSNAISKYHNVISFKILKQI